MCIHYLNMLYVSFRNSRKLDFEYGNHMAVVLLILKVTGALILACTVLLYFNSLVVLMLLSLFLDFIKA